MDMAYCTNEQIAEAVLATGLVQPTTTTADIVTAIEALQVFQLYTAPTDPPQPVIVGTGSVPAFTNYVVLNTTSSATMPPIVSAQGPVTIKIADNMTGTFQLNAFSNQTFEAGSGPDAGTIGTGAYKMPGALSVATFTPDLSHNTWWVS